MYQTILKKFSEDGIHLNDEQDNFLIIFEKNLPRKSFIPNFFKKNQKKVVTSMEMLEGEKL